MIPTSTLALVSRAQATSSATDPNTIADLSVTIDGPPPPVKEGEEQTYTITAVNNGPDLAENVVLVDDLHELSLPAMTHETVGYICY